MTGAPPDLMAEHKQTDISGRLGPGLRCWLGRAGRALLGAAFGLAGTLAAGWITGVGPVDRLVTLPVALGLLLWLLAQLGQEVAAAVAARQPRPATCRRGACGEDMLFTLLGLAATMLPGPSHWLALGLLPVLGVLVR